MINILGGLFLFSLFNGIFFNLNLLPDFCRLWDELITIYLIFMAIFKIIKNKGCLLINDDFCFLIPWLIIIFIGGISNFIWDYAGSWQAVISDIVGFIKFPICFIALRFLGYDKKIRFFLEKHGFTFLKVIITIIFIFGIVSIFKDIGLSQSDEIRHGIYSYEFLFNHPNSLGLVMVLILCLLDSNDNPYNIKYELMCLFTLILTMRSKILAFVAIYIYIKYGKQWSKKYKILFWMSAICLILLVLYNKLSVVMMWTESGRMSFWFGSIELAKKCFPVGSGFGTFASHISGKYFSKVYNFMHIKEIFDEQGHPTAVLGDTGYPYYIAQFGAIGIILLIYSIKKLIRLISKEMNWSALLLLIYLSIALTGESTLLNAGVEIACVLAVIIAKDQDSFTFSVVGDIRK